MKSPIVSRIYPQDGTTVKMLVYQDVRGFTVSLLIADVRNYGIKRKNGINAQIGLAVSNPAKPVFAPTCTPTFYLNVFQQRTMVRLLPLSHQTSTRLAA